MERVAKKQWAAIVNDVYFLRILKGMKGDVDNVIFQSAEKEVFCCKV